MPTTFPIHPSLFITLDSIHERGDAVIDSLKAKTLMDLGYVTLHGTDWHTTSKGRQFMKLYGRTPEFISIVRADWPHQLLASIRKCQYNSQPDLPNEALQALLNTGYLIHAETGSWMMTDKARELLRKYAD
ncbi:MAG TPA: hypothetical protein VK974_04880 [Methylophilaceae bacterium]|nr:hypothetical protein [Methylophilaceae bacterium]